VVSYLKFLFVHYNIGATVFIIFNTVITRVMCSAFLRFALY